ncbi:MAG: murein biosynthesis integral membrane protein MurJ, partial [Deltaproteobacteria bacterium]
MDASKGTPAGQSAAGPDEQGRITQAARLLGGLTLLSRVAGLLRDLVIAALFGASASADAFFVAFRIPNLFRRIVAEGAASTAFVPVFTSYRTREGDRSATEAAAAVGGAAVVVLAVVVGLGVVLADPVVTLFAPGFGADLSKRALTVSLLRWTFPYLLLVGLAAWAMGTLHSFRRFTEPSLGPILLNVAIIGSAVGLAPHLREPVYALAAGVLIGGSLQFLVQAPTLSSLGVRWPDMWRARHPARGRVGRLLVPTLFGGAVYQIGILVSTILASLLPERSISYLWYADRVFEFPLGIVA